MVVDVTITGKNGGASTTIPVTVTTTSGETGSQVANDIAGAMQQAELSASVTAGGNTDVASGQSLGNITSFQTTAVAPGTAPNTTGATITITGNCKDPIIQFGNLISGYDHGVPAVYLASIVYGSVNDQSIITYDPNSPLNLSEISSQTFATLLAGLPASDQQYLTFNSATNAITFEGSPGEDSSFVSIGTSDPQTSIYCEICVPEPSSVLVLGISGVLVLLGKVWHFLRRTQAV
jgi:hypothetical protein